MPTDRGILTGLYHKIATLEMVESLRRCALIWHKITPYQFQATFKKGSDFWDIYLSKMPTYSNVIVDIWKNATYFGSLNSDNAPEILSLFNDLDDDDFYDQDKRLLHDIQVAEICGPVTYNIYPVPAGVVGNGTADVLCIHRHFVVLSPPAARVSGYFDSFNNIQSFHTTGVGLRAAGTFASNDNIWNIIGDTNGPLAAGSSKVMLVVNFFVTPAGVYADGSSYNIYGEVGSGGVWASGQADVFTIP
jgi:hypothetical protein